MTDKYEDMPDVVYVESENDDAGKDIWIVRDYINNVGDKSQQGGWMPIESAPKDGSCFQAGWFIDPSDPLTFIQEKASYIDGHPNEFWNGGIFRSEYTHWMPLPTPPEQASANQESEE